ncbi:MAG: ribosome maturation factor RimP [Actinomycetia bacterium]|nr:ribosome maturation factor RimP [Actinomycetes bacterium]MCP4225772.1 ribosome maturation factor RimP [Actinomycetes bacterium]
MTVQERVQELLAPIIATLGVELLEVEFSGNALRLTVEEGDGGVTSERLAEVNRLVSPILDQHDPVPGRYTLEVSSPGLERPLKRAEHFLRAVGEQVVVKLVPDCEPRRLRGSLVSVEDGSIVIDTVEINGVELDESEHRTVAIETIASGRTLFEWGPGPKPGQPGAKKPNPPGAKKNKKTKKNTADKSKTPSQPRGAR